MNKLLFRPSDRLDQLVVVAIIFIVVVHTDRLLQNAFIPNIPGMSLTCMPVCVCALTIMRNLSLSMLTFIGSRLTPQELNAACTDATSTSFSALLTISTIVCHVCGSVCAGTPTC
jgi:hypothetical protein